MVTRTYRRAITDARLPTRLDHHLRGDPRPVRLRLLRARADAARPDASGNPPSGRPSTSRIALIFGTRRVWKWGTTFGGEYFAGYVTEKALSVDNLFVFVIIMSTFAVPREYQQKVLLIGIVMALVMRGVFIAVGAAAINTYSWVFYLFGAFLIYTAIKLIRDSGHEDEAEEERESKVMTFVEAVPADHRRVRRRQAVHQDRRQARRHPDAAGAGRHRLHRRAVRARLDPGDLRPDRRSRTSCSPPTPSR